MSVFKYQILLLIRQEQSHKLTDSSLAGAEFNGFGYLYGSISNIDVFFGGGGANGSPRK